MGKPHRLLGAFKELGSVQPVQTAIPEGKSMPCINLNKWQRRGLRRWGDIKKYILCQTIFQYTRIQFQVIKIMTMSVAGSIFLFTFQLRNYPASFRACHCALFTDVTKRRRLRRDKGVQPVCYHRAGFISACANSTLVEYHKIRRAAHITAATVLQVAAHTSRQNDAHYLSARRCLCL